MFDENDPPKPPAAFVQAVLVRALPAPEKIQDGIAYAEKLWAALERNGYGAPKAAPRASQGAAAPGGAGANGQWKNAGAVGEYVLKSKLIGLEQLYVYAPSAELARQIDEVKVKLGVL